MKFTNNLKFIISKLAYKKSNYELGNFKWLLNHMPPSVIPALEVSPIIKVHEDLSLADRVIVSYKRANDIYKPSASGWDIEILQIKKEVHDALLSGNLNDALRVLRNPASNTFFWGFDAISSSPNGEVEPHELVIRRLSKRADWMTLYALWIYDALTSLAEIIGSRRVDYPEVDLNIVSNIECSVDEILDGIDKAIGFPLLFPNPYPGEHGLKSTRGIIGFRSIQAAYQAYRIAQLSNGNQKYKVMEIGGGLGRTAYFANLFGIRDYTIVDIPLSNAAQGYFLGRVVGADKIQLYSDVELDNSNMKKIKIIPPSAIDTTQKYDLIINVDSWTEMSPDISGFYWSFARQAALKVLSINHEHNPQTVRDLYIKDSSVNVTRFPYCMRRGYIEEILTWK